MRNTRYRKHILFRKYYQIWIWGKWLCPPRPSPATPMPETAVIGAPRQNLLTCLRACIRLVYEITSYSVLSVVRYLHLHHSTVHEIITLARRQRLVSSARTKSVKWHSVANIDCSLQFSVGPHAYQHQKTFWTHRLPLAAGHTTNTPSKVAR